MQFHHLCFTFDVLLDLGRYEACNDLDISPNKAKATCWLAKGEKNTEECFESERLLITGDARYWWSGSKGYQVVVAEESYPIFT